MRSGRSYQAARPVGNIVEELRRLRGRQFDGHCVDAFLTTMTPEMRQSTMDGRDPAGRPGASGGLGGFGGLGEAAFWLSPVLSGVSSRARVA